MKKLILISIVILVSASSAWYWYEFIFPLKEFKRLGEIQFPEGTRALEWESSGFQFVKGRFQIPKSGIDNFIAHYKLSDGGYVGSDVMVASLCIQNNAVTLRLSKETDIVKIEIITPDHSGDAACS